MIELSSEARKAYEVMVLNIEQTPQSEPAANSEHQVRADQINAVSDLDSTQPEEPEYSKLLFVEIVLQQTSSMIPKWW